MERGKTDISCEHSRNKTINSMKLTGKKLTWKAREEKLFFSSIKKIKMVHSKSQISFNPFATIGDYSQHVLRYTSAP